MIKHPCDKFESAGHRGGGHCKLHNRTVSVTGCSRCPENPNPGQVPLIHATIALKPIPRKPLRFTLEQLAKAQAAADVCDKCEHKQKVTREKNGFQVYGVRCGKCGTCGMRSLLRPCPIGLR